MNQLISHLEALQIHSCIISGLIKTGYDCVPIFVETFALPNIDSNVGSSSYLPNKALLCQRTEQIIRFEQFMVSMIPEDDLHSYLNDSNSTIEKHDVSFSLKPGHLASLQLAASELKVTGLSVLLSNKRASPCIQAKTVTSKVSMSSLGRKASKVKTKKSKLTYKEDEVAKYIVSYLRKRLDKGIEVKVKFLDGSPYVVCQFCGYDKKVTFRSATRQYEVYDNFKHIETCRLKSLKAEKTKGKTQRLKKTGSLDKMSTESEDDEFSAESTEHKVQIKEEIENDDNIEPGANDILSVEIKTEDECLLESEASVFFEKV